MGFAQITCIKQAFCASAPQRSHFKKRADGPMSQQVARQQGDTSLHLSQPSRSTLHHSLPRLLVTARIKTGYEKKCISRTFVTKGRITDTRRRPQGFASAAGAEYWPRPWSGKTRSRWHHSTCLPVGRDCAICMQLQG